MKAIAMELFTRFAADLADLSTIETPPTIEGRSMYMILSSSVSKERLIALRLAAVKKRTEEKIAIKAAKALEREERKANGEIVEEESDDEYDDGEMPDEDEEDILETMDRKLFGNVRRQDFRGGRF